MGMSWGSRAFAWTVILREAMGITQGHGGGVWVMPGVLHGDVAGKPDSSADGDHEGSRRDAGGMVQGRRGDAHAAIF